MTTRKKTAKKAATAPAPKSRRWAKASHAKPAAQKGAKPQSTAPTRKKRAPIRATEAAPAARRQAARKTKGVSRQPARAKATAKAKPARKPVIPPYLLEGDFPEAKPVMPPKAEAVLPPAGAGPALPEAYGTRALVLTATDPRWLYMSWDYTSQQLQEAEARSNSGRLHLRVHIEQVTEHPYLEIQLPPGAQHWFVHVDKPATRFAGELGYYDQWGLWNSLGQTETAITPPEAPAPDTTVCLATLPPEAPLPKLLEAVKAAAKTGPVAAALAQRGLPGAGQPGAGGWTPEQERALAELVAMDSQRRLWIGSLEITELVKRQLAGEQPPGAAALPTGEQPASPAAGFGAGAGEVPSSPTAPAVPPKGFWFHINAELVVYGATEPDAEVTLGGRRISLRPDGTFTCRFALPDGQYELPAVAVSADRTDGRAAELKFSRQTLYRGDVGTQPPETSLEPPPPEQPG